MRVYHGHFVPPCKQAFEILLGKIVEASCSQTPRDIATVLWSIAKISNVESLHIRRQGQVEAGMGHSLHICVGTVLCQIGQWSFWAGEIAFAIR